MSNYNDFNSALALFQSLYKSHKGDIYTVIERFILGGVRSKHLSTVTVATVSELLKEQFNIDIPNSIIQYCINRQDVFQYKNGEYYVINKQEKEIDALLKELNAIDAQNENIVSSLFEEIEHNRIIRLTDVEKNQIREVFFDFVKDRDKEHDFKYFIDIYQFIVKREKDIEFQMALNAIKEGMIIYHGIRYSETTDARTWKENTIFFLDMEYLFSSYGMNGSFYEECFFDFYNLVKEINDGSPSKNGIPRIQLKYFPETRNNIDRFFSKAARIKKGDEYLYKEKEAMSNILNNSEDEIGVFQYKAGLYKKLNDLGITEYSKEIDLEKNREYIFDTETLIDNIKRDFESEDIDDIDELLLFADYINILRKGKKTVNPEKCGFIFLSDSKLSTRFSKYLHDNDSDAPSYLICRMNYFTEDMWFKLRKGIVNQESIATFKVISKAKSIVSSLLSDSVLYNYKKIVEEEKDPEEKKILYAELRNKRHNPENVTSESIDDDVSFILDRNFIESYRENQSKLAIKAGKYDVVEKQLGERIEENKILKDENNELRKEISKRNYDLLLEKRNKTKRRFFIEGFIYNNAKIIIWFIIVILLVISLLFELSSLTSPVGIIAGLATILSLSIQLSCNIGEKSKKLMRQRYRVYIEKYIYG